LTVFGADFGLESDFYRPTPQQQAVSLSVIYAG